MNGYSKISAGTAHKSRSIDFSDFFSFPQTPKPSSRKIASTTHTATAIPEEEPEPNNLQVKKTKTHNSSREAEREDEGGNGERFGVILGRSGSVSSASGFQATVKRAFSMRRSSSVSERYCRIHDQYMAIASPIGIGDEIDGDGIGTRRSMKKKHRGGKILKACKRLLGL